MLRGRYQMQVCNFSLQESPLSCSLKSTGLLNSATYFQITLNTIDFFLNFTSNVSLVIPSGKTWFLDIEVKRFWRSEALYILNLLHDNIMSNSIYAVVEFVEEQSVALAAESWLVYSETFVMWPPYKSQTRVDRTVQKREAPSNGYQKFPCRVLYKTSKFWTGPVQVIMCPFPLQNYPFP